MTGHTRAQRLSGKVLCGRVKTTVEAQTRLCFHPDKMLFFLPEVWHESYQRSSEVCVVQLRKSLTPVFILQIC